MQVGAGEVIWAPQAGSQMSFMTCPFDEVLIEGNRGGGKTDVLLMDYLQGVGVGYGEDWRGILFREEYTQLTDVINKCNKWIKRIFPGAKYNGSEHRWSFPDGEQLYLRYMRVASDYWSYHGHEYPWIGWEELTNWATDECYLSMFSCNRSSNPDLPRKVRATCNPAGVGHAWVKRRFIDAMKPMRVFTDKKTGRTRVRIPSKLDENLILNEADPGYVNTILEAAQNDPVKFKAWVEGSWDIIAGGFFVDLWEPDIHILEEFPIPTSWKIVRSFDWGSSKPWSVTYLAECNGEQPDFAEEMNLPYFPKGSVIVVGEIYGWNGVVNEGDRATSQQIAERVAGVDDYMYLMHKVKVKAGPADLNIFEVRDGTSMAKTMLKHGLYWTRAYKGSGSRVAGWGMLRSMLGAAMRREMENPRLYFFENAKHHIRTLPLQQTDDKNTEDIDTDGEDHAMDSLRYGLTRRLSGFKRRKVGY